jgi:hypothetical protein
MTKEAVKMELAREPFVPLRLHLTNGKTFDVPFREVAHIVAYGVLVLIGLKKGTHQARSYDRFSFEQIARIERRPAKGSTRGRKKAS